MVPSCVNRSGAVTCKEAVNGPRSAVDGITA